MKFLLVSVALLFCGGALAEGGSAASSGNAADVRKTDNVPTGGCMPIGLTARGELVFPMQCREILERERGPASDDLTSRAPPTVQPVVQQDVATPEPPTVRAPAGKLSAVRHRRKQSPQPKIQAQAKIQVIGSTAKKP
jgi:hypothetical protein